MAHTRRVAIVTGAARGIGAAIATRLAHDGRDVAVLDLDHELCTSTVEAARAHGAAAVAVAVDVCDPAQVAHAVNRVRHELGAPTILVNNAGVTRDNLLFRMTDDDWDTVVGVHLRGAFLLCRAVQADMVEAGWGRIVNISSTSALGNRGQVNYAAAKAGIQGFTKTVAIELGPFGVTANAIAPGIIASEMTAATAQRLGISFERYLADAAAATAVRRVGSPEDVAALASFLTGEEAGYVSGQVVYVAGGPTS